MAIVLTLSFYKSINTKYNISVIISIIIVVVYCVILYIYIKFIYSFICLINDINATKSYFLVFSLKYIIDDKISQVKTIQFIIDFNCSESWEEILAGASNILYKYLVIYYNKMCRCNSTISGTPYIFTQSCFQQNLYNEHNGIVYGTLWVITPPASELHSSSLSHPSSIHAHIIQCSIQFNSRFFSLAICLIMFHNNLLCLAIFFIFFLIYCVRKYVRFNWNHDLAISLTATQWWNYISWRMTNMYLLHTDIGE